VVTVFAAATIEERLNTFIASPLLFMTEKGPRRFLAELATTRLALRMPDKIKFLRDRVVALNDNPILAKVRDLSTRRNRILHISPEYEEDENEQPRLSRKRALPLPPLEQAKADRETACEFLKLMFDVIPYEPWPPPAFET